MPSWKCLLAEQHEYPNHSDEYIGDLADKRNMHTN